MSTSEVRKHKGNSPSKRSAIAKLSRKALKAVLILRLIARVAMTSRLPAEIIRKKWFNKW